MDLIYYFVVCLLDKNIGNTFYLNLWAFFFFGFDDMISGLLSTKCTRSALLLNSTLLVVCKKEIIKKKSKNNKRINLKSNKVLYSVDPNKYILQFT